MDPAPHDITPETGAIISWELDGSLKQYRFLQGHLAKPQLRQTSTRPQCDRDCLTHTSCLYPILSLLKPKAHVISQRWAWMLTFLLPKMAILMKILSSLSNITFVCLLWGDWLNLTYWNPQNQASGLGLCLWDLIFLKNLFSRRDL
jgi:hypothetical protein